MAGELLPSVGSSGDWKVKAPFDTKYVAGLAYGCKAVRELSEVVGTGINAFAEYYQKNGLSKETYEAHVADNIAIITLVSSAGNWLHIPSPYVTGWPSTDVVPYVVMGMVITLGAIPNTLDPTFLTPKVSNAIKAALGHTPEIQYVALSEVANKKWSDHTSLETARKTAISDEYSDYIRRVNAEDELVKAKAEIQALQQYIISKNILPPIP